MRSPQIMRLQLASASAPAKAPVPTSAKLAKEEMRAASPLSEPASEHEDELLFDDFGNEHDDASSSDVSPTSSRNNSYSLPADGKTYEFYDFIRAQTRNVAKRQNVHHTRRIGSFSGAAPQRQELQSSVSISQSAPSQPTFAVPSFHISRSQPLSTYPLPSPTASPPLFAHSLLYRKLEDLAATRDTAEETTRGRSPQPRRLYHPWNKRDQ